MHQILMQRFVRCISAEALADQLGMSSRNLRRLQTRATALLADALLERDHATAAATTGPTHADTTTIDSELEWLRNATGQPASLPVILTDALPVLETVARGLGAEIVNQVPADLPAVAVHPGGLRQAVLSLVHYALEQAGRGKVRLSASVVASRVVFTIQCEPAAPDGALLPSSGSLLIAARILAIFGCKLEEKHEAKGALRLEASLAVAGTTLVLAIDDTADALQLYERYVAGTRYRLAVCRDPAQTLETALSLRPAAIVMDIMMPHLDGWALLGRLYHHPQLQHVPVIVCTIVAERGLALSLGAADFIQKPVTRAALLGALDAHVGCP